MWQSISIIGLNEPTFAEAFDELIAIQNIFKCQVNKDNPEQWQPPGYDKFPLVKLTNWYFTHRSDDPYSSSVPLGQDVDPTGKLTEFTGHEFFHAKITWHKTKLKAKNHSSMSYKIEHNKSHTQ